MPVWMDAAEAEQDNMFDETADEELLIHEGLVFG